jgi:hypothetical protein
VQKGLTDLPSVDSLTHVQGQAEVIPTQVLVPSAISFALLPADIAEALRGISLLTPSN